MTIENLETLETRINSLENVLVVKDGRIISQKLDASFETIKITAEIDANIAFSSDSSEIVKLNEKIRKSTLQIHLPKNTTFKQPLHVFYIAEHEDIAHKTNIIIEENTQFKLFESVTGYHDKTINFVSDTLLKPYATLDYTSLSNGDLKSASAVVRNATIEQHATVTYTNGVFTDGSTNQENHLRLTGAHATATTKTIALTSNHQETLVKTIVEHLAPQSHGFIEHYGVANDASTLIFEGIGKIHKNMRQSEAKQSNKGVVIGDKARLDANPLLLIDEHDVEAGHGAAIGRIDEDQLYYLMSRGLSHREAEKLIINGYIAPLHRVIQSDTIKTHIETLLNQKIQ